MVSAWCRRSRLQLVDKLLDQLACETATACHLTQTQNPTTAPYWLSVIHKGTQRVHMQPVKQHISAALLDEKWICVHWSINESPPTEDLVPSLLIFPTWQPEPKSEWDDFRTTLQSLASYTQSHTKDRQRYREEQRGTETETGWMCHWHIITRPSGSSFRQLVVDSVNETSPCRFQNNRQPQLL